MFKVFSYNVLKLLLFLGLFFVCCNGSAFAKKQVTAEFSVPVGKSLFLLRSTKAPVVWKSSNEGVATVKNGVVFAKGAGKAFIVAKNDDSGNENEQIYRVVVKDTEHVRSSAYINDNGTLKIFAITGKEVRELKTDVNIGGKKFFGTAKNSFENGDVLFWEIPVKVEGVNRGNFVANLYVLVGNRRKKVENSSVTGSFANAKELKGAKVCERTVSKNIVNFIKTWEGFVSSLEVDKLVPGIYNLGHGDVVNYGGFFYNNITPQEAFVTLVDKINSGSYVRDVNEFLTSNNIKCTQEQFDALVSYSYNLGTGWTKSSKLKDILLGAIEPETKMRNLLYVDKDKLKEEVLIKHHVLNPKRCIVGLLLRRIHELNVFLYGDYSINKPKNKYGYVIPECIEDDYNKYFGLKRGGANTDESPYPKKAAM